MPKHSVERAARLHALEAASAPFVLALKTKQSARSGVSVELNESHDMEEWLRLLPSRKKCSVDLICGSDGALEQLVQSVAAAVVWQHTPLPFRDLILLQPPRVELLPVLHHFFRKVIGQTPNYRLLPQEELLEVLRLPPDERRDLFIGGAYDADTDTLAFTRGHLETLVVPHVLFRPSGTAAADPMQLGLTDYGHTVLLGPYEASVEGILYEVDADYRKRARAKRRKEEKGFGPSLRRLRLLRGLPRDAFPGISEKTIARLEREESAKPREKTLSIIAQTLGVEPAAIETY